MGCDIHSWVEVKSKDDGVWRVVGDVFPMDEFGREYYKKECSSEPFQDRSYSLFGWLAGVRNYSYVEPLDKQRGWPGDTSIDADEDYLHSHSWFTLEELLSVDYDHIVTDWRVMRQEGPRYWNGAAKAESEDQASKKSLREFLGTESCFFRSLEVMRTLGDPKDVRVLFAFDN